MEQTLTDLLNSLIAAARAMGAPEYTEISFGPCPEIAALLRQTPSAHLRATVYSNNSRPYVIEVVEVDWEGYRLHAFSSREATEAEAARLAKPDYHHQTDFVTVRL